MFLLAIPLDSTVQIETQDHEVYFYQSSKDCDLFHFLIVLKEKGKRIITYVKDEQDAKETVAVLVRAKNGLTFSDAKEFLDEITEYMKNPPGLPEKVSSAMEEWQERKAAKIHQQLLEGQPLN